MKKRTVAWIAIAFILLVAVVGFGWTFFGIHEVSMPQADLQARIDQKMPVTQKGVTFSGVKLDLSNNKINLDLDATTTKFKTEYKMHCYTMGTMRYDTSRGSFYFHPEQVKFNDVRANGKNVAEKVGGLIDKWVDKQKIIDSQMIKDNKAEIMQFAEDKTQSLVQSSAESVLERVPVYTIKDDNIKGWVIKSALKSVEVKDGKVIAHISLWQLTTVVIGYVVLFLLGIAFLVLLCMNPEWGMALVMVASIAGGGDGG